MSTVEERLAALERQNVRMKALLFAVAITVALTAFIAASSAERHVQVTSLEAQRINLVDPEGNAIGFLGWSEEGASSLSLRQGRTMVSLVASKDIAQAEVSGGPDNRVTMEAGQQTLISVARDAGRVTVDATDREPSIALLDSAGKPRAVLHGRSQDPCLMFVEGDFDKVRAYIGAPSGGGRIRLVDDRGRGTVLPR